LPATPSGADSEHSAAGTAPGIPATLKELEGTMTEVNGRDRRDEQRREAALTIALRTGLLRKCLCHGEVYDPGQHDYQGACMVAAFLINRDDPLVESFEGDRAPLTELLKSICHGYEKHCSRCAESAAS
jgi:hypothetical protein